MIETTEQVLGGLAILENAYDRTGRGRSSSSRTRSARPASARCTIARRLLMAALPFDDLDVLIVDEMGKNISGTGMDTNVLGRMFVPGVPEEPIDHGSPPSSCSI